MPLLIEGRNETAGRITRFVAPGKEGHMDAVKQPNPGPKHFDDIQTDLTDIIFSKIFHVIVTGSLGLILATALTAYRYGDPRIWLIFWLELVTCGARLGVALAFRRRRSATVLTVGEAKRWEYAYGAITFFYACLLAALTARIYQRHDLAGEVLCSIGSISVAAGLSSRLGLRPWIMKAGGIILLATLCVSAMASGQTFVIFGGLMAGLYSLSFMETADRNFEIVVNQLRGQRELRWLSEQDSLTLLPNRRQFHKRLAEACESDAVFAILFLDLDAFKAVNDTMGHAAGDELLRQVAVRLGAMARNTDLVARLGGDEFAILMCPVNDIQQVAAVAQRINQQIAAPYTIFSKPVGIGVSIGVRMGRSEGLSADTLLTQADAALYGAKVNGKGSFRFAESEMASLG